MKKIKNYLAKSLTFLPDKIFCSITFLIKNKRLPNLDKPTYFNDKLLKLKLTERNPIQHTLVDKYAVREYIKEVIGKEYLIPLIGVYKSTEEIDFDKLPDKFVLKITNGSQNNIVCINKDQLNWVKVSRQLKKWMNINYYKRTREWQYNGIETKIVIEKYLTDPSGDLLDYKFYCFHGVPKFVQIDSSRFTGHKRDFYDIHLNEKIEFTMTYQNSNNTIQKPEGYAKMIEIVKSLSHNFKFIRVDLYNVSGVIYFGEITFYPDNCNGLIRPKKYEKILGNMLNI